MWVQEQVGRLVAELEQAETWDDQTEPAVQTAAVVASAATGALVAPGPRLGEVWVYSRAGAPLDCSLQVKTVLSDEKLHENSPESETSLH